MEKNYLKTAETLRNSTICTIAINIMLFIYLIKYMLPDIFAGLVVFLSGAIVIIFIELIIGLLIRFLIDKDIGNGIFAGLVISIIIGFIYSLLPQF
ncbi:MAG: hypothetical protein HY819_12430 [Acidobacteria bacterium]|nr:hypothetical protein [Acidobacteriota bacterium]